MLLGNSVNILTPDKTKRSILARNLRTAKNRPVPHIIEVDVAFLMELGESQNWLCALSGHPLEFVPGTTVWDGRVCNPMICTIDRKDNSQGYTKSNVQLVTWFVNNIKGSLSDDQFIDMCKKIATVSG